MWRGWVVGAERVRRQRVVRLGTGEGRGDGGEGRGFGAGELEGGAGGLDAIGLDAIGEKTGGDGGGSTVARWKRGRRNRGEVRRRKGALVRIQNETKQNQTTQEECSASPARS